MSVTVKVCGITRAADADFAVASGADALGFNFYPKSPRYIDPAHAAAMTTPDVLRVGIFVDTSLRDIAEVARKARLDVVQVYGDQTPAFNFPLPVWKAFRVTPEWTGAACGWAEAVLLDGPTPGEGTPFDWKAAGRMSTRFLIAGGLDGDNVAEAIRTARPWGVDACSRLESAPGIKDPEKVARFIQAARTAIV